MSKKRLFCIITAVLLMFMLINLFIPMIGNSSVSYSLWGYADANNTSSLGIVILLELIAGIVICGLSFMGILKDYKFVYFPVGYYLTYFLIQIFSCMEADSMDYVRIGMWLGVLASLAALVLTIIGNNFASDVAGTSMYRNNRGGYNNGGYNGYNNGYNNNMGYNQNNGGPYYNQNQPYNQNMGPPMYR